MNTKGFRKGKYEEAVEYAKELLDEGVGGGEIQSRTGINEEDIRKIQTKMEKELNDKN